MKLHVATTQACGNMSLAAATHQCWRKHVRPHKSNSGNSTMADLLAAYRHTSGNWPDIEASRVCGCCSCVQVFSPDEIVAWAGLDISNIDDPEAVKRQTALCPRCGSEAVIGDKSGYPVNTQFLTRMNEAWFQRTIIRKPTPKK